MRISTLSSLVLSVLLSFETLNAQSADEIVAMREQIEALKKSVSELSAVVKGQQQTIDQLKAQSTQPLKEIAVTAAEPAPASAPVSAARSSSAGGMRLGALNPEIGVIGDIVGTLSESSEDEEGNDRLSLRELEIIFGHDVDPYSRFDATIAFSDSEDPEVDEAYLTHFGIPGGFKAYLGRIRPNVGLAAKLHRDTLETVDEPLVVQRLFGVEGLSRTGLEISNFIPTSWDTPTHEFAVGIIEGGNGEDGTLFGDTRRRPSFYGRLRHSFDISENSLLNIGNTFLLGSGDDDSSNEVRAFGLDAAFVHNFNSINRLKLQSELYLQDRSIGILSEDGEGELMFGEEAMFHENPLGLYGLADYRIAERWSLGARYDYVEPTEKGEGINSNESAYSAYITFHQSEFARWRFQYQLADMLDGEQDNRFFLQATVAIGTHKHQLQ